MIFVRVVQPGGEPANWRVMIRNIGELVEWYFQQSHVSSGFLDMTRRLARGRHPVTPLGRILEVRGCRGLQDFAEIAANVVFHAKVGAMPLLINSNGGWCPYEPGFHEIEERRVGEGWPA